MQKVSHFVCYTEKYIMKSLLNERMKPSRVVKAATAEIIVAGDGSLKPFIHSFRHEPENVAFSTLGSIFGVFEIEDHSEDSAYIVNFLSSVSKKEYFAHPKRPAVESLEATLHKINRALAELVKQDNTAWFGRLNAVLCALENDRLHFSVAGKARALLIRNAFVNDIGNGLAETSTVHPIKTFAEVASGRLKVNDKIILATPELFDIFAMEDIRKNAERLPREKFERLIKTAMLNQFSFGGTLIVDILEANENDPLLVTANPRAENEDTALRTAPNAFSQSAFKQSRNASRKSSSENVSEAAASHSSDSSEKKPPEELQDYTDSKTGHIYVQGDTPETAENEWQTHVRWLTENAIAHMRTSSVKSFRHWRKSCGNLFRNARRMFAALTPVQQKYTLVTLFVVLIGTVSFFFFSAR
jgi:hypothetical protein